MGKGREHVICVLGMALVWPAVQNQMLYPATFIFNKTSSASAFAFYLLYALLFAITCCIMLLHRANLTEKLFESRILMPAGGILGSAGIVLIGFCDPIDGVTAAINAAGYAFVALYAPLYFIYWSSRLAGMGKGAFALDAILSYLVFCLITCIRLAVGLHAIWLAIVFPLIAAVLVVVSPMPDGAAAVRNARLKRLPLRIIIPSIAFIYLCGIVATAFNPQAALSSYPPNRFLLYLVLALVLGLVCLIFRRYQDDWERAEMISFAFLSVAMAAAILLAGFGTTGEMDVGNYPIIGGKIAFQFFLWLLLLITAARRHADLILSLCLFLIAAVLVPNLIGAGIIYSQGLIASASSDSIVLLGITICSAFVVSAIVNVFLAVSLSKTAPVQNVGQTPSAPTIAYDDAKHAFDLSNRETEIVQLICQKSTTKEIANSLFIAETTVYSHLKSIYRKTGVHSKQELIDLMKEYRP